MFANQIIFSEDSEVISTNINSSSSEAVNFKTNHQQNDINQTLDLSQDYVQNYLPAEMMHHSQHHGHGMKIQVYEATGMNQQPIMAQKYVEYPTHHINEDGQMLVTNEMPDSDGEFEELNELKTPSSKHVKRNLPHKKRIAKKLNSSQPYANDYSLMMPNVPVVAAPVFECNICGAGLPDQLQFFVHLKGHYEPQEMQVELKEKDEEQFMMDQRPHQHQESLQEGIKVEEIAGNVIDEFNEFSEPEDLMEDLRKEVEKVVENIADNECDQQQWTYQSPDEIKEDAEQHAEDIQLYAENLIQSNPNSIESTYEEIDNPENQVSQEPAETEEDEDDVPLEQVKQSMQRVVRSEEPRKPVEDDREDLELTECLKKIHNFKCSYPSCGKAFNSRTALGYHLKTHTTERRYVCDQCGKKFLTNGALKVHQRLHTDDRPYECKFPGCGKSFRQWGDLKYHETSIHSNKKDHVCEFCAKAFARKYSLVIHRRIHTGERNYKCPDCDKSFRASSYLLNHKRIHTGEKPYCCSVLSCQKKFRVVGDLKRHMKIHDRSKTAPPKDRKKEVVISNNLKKDKEVTELIVNETNIDDECVDLSFKEEDRNLVYSNNQIDIYAKSAVNDESKRNRKAVKSRKAK